MIFRRWGAIRQVNKQVDDQCSKEKRTGTVRSSWHPGSCCPGTAATVGPARSLPGLGIEIGMAGALHDLVREHVAGAIDGKAQEDDTLFVVIAATCAGYRLNCSRRRVTDVCPAGATRGAPPLVRAGTGGVGGCCSSTFGGGGGGVSSDRRWRCRRRRWGRWRLSRLAAAAVRGSALSRLDRRCRRTATDQARSASRRRRFRPDDGNRHRRQRTTR